MARLKPKCDDQIIDAINKHWEKYKIPPTIDYIIENSCIESKSTTWKALRRLEKRGIIHLIFGKAVPNNVWVYIGRAYESEKG